MGGGAMAYFVWKEAGLTADCASLEAMASRFEESAALMRRLAEEGFWLERHAGASRIHHADPALFEAYGFINEEPPQRQLTVFSD